MTSLIISPGLFAPACALALLLSVGCSAVLDPDRHQRGDSGETADGGGDADGGGGDDGGGPACGELDFTCAPEAPTGWSGPIVLVTGDGAEPAPPCPPTAPSMAFAAYGGLTAASAICGCDCDPPDPAELSCGPVTLEVGLSCGTGSGGGTTHATIEPGECKAVSDLPSSGGWYASGSLLTSTACTAVSTEDVPPIVWDRAHRGCGFGDPEACSEGVCAPPLEEGQRLCVYVDGETSCPPAFPDALVTAEGARDARGCSTCTCGAVEGACDGSLSLQSTCSGRPMFYADIPLGSCTSAEAHASPHVIQASFGPGEISCPPSPVEPTGDATPRDVRTICCAP